MKANPSFQFYPADWLRDPGLRSCSLAARGLWIDMLGFMHEAEPYGHLRLNGQDIGPDILARMVGTSVKVIHRLLTELETAGVFSRNPKVGSTGTIYSRRMVRDHANRENRGQYGHLSQNHPLVPRKKSEKDTFKDSFKDTLGPSIDGSIGVSPSSSSSSSSSKEKNTDTHNGNGHADQAWKKDCERFLAAYPKQQHTGPIEKWFMQHRPTAELVEQMLAKIAEFKTTATWQEKDGQFVPLPLKWLNDKCWKDVARVDVPRKQRPATNCRAGPSAS